MCVNTFLDILEDIKKNQTGSLLSESLQSAKDKISIIYMYNNTQTHKPYE